jgi:hypothetical protein
MKHLLSIVCALICALTCLANDALATPTLYALSTNGRLYTVNEDTGFVVEIRGPLPAQTYYSLAMIDGKFYTYDAAGRFYKFGFTTGDQVNLGTVSNVVRGMSVRPRDGRLFAVVSTNGDVYGDVIGEVNLMTGGVSNFMTVPDSHATSMYAIGFLPNSEMFGTSAVEPSGWSWVYRIYQPSGVMYDVRSSGVPYYAGTNKFAAIAVNPETHRVFMASTPAYHRFFEYFSQYPSNPGYASYTTKDFYNNTSFHVMGGLAYNFSSSSVGQTRVIVGNNSAGTRKVTVANF